MAEGREILAAVVAVGATTNAEGEVISGEDALLDDLYEKVVSGMDTKEFSASLGIVPSVLWEWMHSKPGRITRYRHALRDRADMLAHQSLRDVENATPETVPLAKLRAEHRLKLASKWDRENYGDDPKAAGSAGGITVVVNRDAALRLVDDRTLVVE